jgi:hypothetical protein
MSLGQVFPTHQSLSKAENSESASTIRRIVLKEISRSKRRGHWYRLSRMDRSFLTLVTRVQPTFRSPPFMKALVSILKRLKEVGDRVYSVVVSGTRLAWSFSNAAVSWGNASAKEWRNDRSYILYLGSCLLGCGAWRPTIWSGGRA